MPKNRRENRREINRTTTVANVTEANRTTTVANVTEAICLGYICHGRRTISKKSMFNQHHYGQNHKTLSKQSKLSESS